MAGRKKIIKKKLKEPDEFITLTEKAYLFVKDHLRTIATGGIVLFVILLSTFLFLRWEGKKEGEAYQLFGSALEIYQMLSSPYREGKTSEYKALLEKFDEVITKFPRTAPGKFSLLYKGNIYLRLEGFDEAIKSYQTFLQKSGKERLYRLFALEGLGYAYEGKKEYEKALGAYRTILEGEENVQSAGAYLNIGRCYEKLGKRKEALESYRAFLKVTPKSMMANLVSGRISHLEE